MDDLDRLRKLLALALFNPSEEEARSAAITACRLIQEKNITIGGERVTMPVREWTAPSQEFEDTLKDITANRQTPGSSGAPNEGNEFGAGEKLKAPIQDNDIDDDFMRKRVIKAWHMIREERENLRREIHNANERFRSKSQRDYEPMYKEHR